VSKKIVKSFAIAMSGPFVLWLGNLTGIIDVGIWLPIVSGVIAVVVNAIKVWVEAHMSVV
jgi:hypothetical protein